jgi:molecular chaperone GrpE
MTDVQEKGKQAAKKEHHKTPAGKKNSAGQKCKADEPVAAETVMLQDRLLRLQADFENFRKRTLREKNELYQRANEDLMEELLPVIDHLDLALQSAGEHGGAQAADASFVEGVRLVATQLLSALGKFGLSPLDAEGQVFDHNLHEAIAHLPSSDVPENRVITQTRRGYKLGDRLLRPVQVVVSNGPATDDAGRAVSETGV